VEADLVVSWTEQIVEEGPWGTISAGLLAAANVPVAAGCIAALLEMSLADAAIAADLERSVDANSEAALDVRDTRAGGVVLVDGALGSLLLDWGCLEAARPVGVGRGSIDVGLAVGVERAWAGHISGLDAVHGAALLGAGVEPGSGVAAPCSGGVVALSVGPAGRDGDRGQLGEPVGRAAEELHLGVGGVGHALLGSAAGAWASQELDDFGGWVAALLQ